MARNKDHTSKTERTSANVQSEDLDKLRQVFPQFVKDGQIDFDALKSFFAREGLLAKDEKYGLGWAGKSDAFGLIREPATGTLTPDKKESKDWDKTQNLFIEGDNLEVLKLLQARYREQIKMIYIDPPYNTGGDFIYRDNFHENKGDYETRTGQRAESGARLMKNTESGGRYHSDWLTMMYPRLFLAKNLLRSDGVIFISIDNHEVMNLRHICDEIFGEENFVAQITREAIRGGSQSKNIRRVHDYVLAYSKRPEELQFTGLEQDGFVLDKEDSKGKYAIGRELNKWGAASRREDSPSMWFPIKGPNGEEVYPIRNDGSEGRWRLGRTKMNELVENDDVIFEKRKNGTYIAYQKLRDDSERIKQFKTLFLKDYINAKGSETIKKIFNIERSYFDYVKPIELMEDLVTMADVGDDEIVLDFFAGSGSTAHAVIQQNAEDGGNRKWIMVQLDEATEEKSEAKKAGYDNIAQIARERIRRTGERVKEDYKEKLAKREIPLDTGFKTYELEKSSYRQWRAITVNDDEETLKKQMELFAKKPLIDNYDEQSVIYEVLLKEGFSLNSTVTQENSGDLNFWRVTDADKQLVVTFADKLTQGKIAALNLPKDTTFVCLDTSLDDTTKVNLSRNLTVKVI